MDQDNRKSMSGLSRRMSKVGLLAAMKTFTRPHFQRKKKCKAETKYQQSRSWDSGLSNIGNGRGHQGGHMSVMTSGGPVSPTMGTVGSYRRIYWPGSSSSFITNIISLPRLATHPHMSIF